jgi:hypothetical protein
MVAGAVAEWAWAAVRCLFALRGGEDGGSCSGSSWDRSGRTGALRFRDGGGAVAGVEEIAPVLADDGVVSAACLAAERVFLGGMSKYPSMCLVTRSEMETSGGDDLIARTREMGDLAGRACRGG